MVGLRIDAWDLNFQVTNRLAGRTRGIEFSQGREAQKSRGPCCFHRVVVLWLLWGLICLVDGLPLPFLNV
ncbi:hypothetical protein IAD21_05534 [Abditibacteriota bacterium]|nr:hypothetical protein IAD21_05534 [Abditibacteriota bacterium]